MSTRRDLSVALVLLPALTGCYVVPVSPEQMAWLYGHPSAPVVAAPGAGLPGGQTLPARLYPQNDKAAQVGMLNGSIANFAEGKGRFTLQYRGEPLTGEATRRLDGEGRGGVAAAYGPSGTFLTCEYQMRNARTGVGTCSVSDGARFQVHVGD